VPPARPERWNWWKPYSRIDLLAFQIFDERLEGGDMAAFLAEDLKEFVPEGLRLGPLRAFCRKRAGRPFPGKRDGA